MKLLTRIHRLIRYGGPVELIKGAFRFVYWQSGLRATRHALGYKFHGSPVTKTIKNMTASFEVSTQQSMLEPTHSITSGRLSPM